MDTIKCKQSLSKQSNPDLCCANVMARWFKATIVANLNPGQAPVIAFDQP